MTIWLLALVLLASLAAVGYTQGAIRVGISFVGILLAALLAGPLAGLVRPALSALGVANPVLLWLLPPFIVFVVVLSAVKVGGLTVHKKVDVYYKYKAGELRLALWERLNARLGAGLGLLNGLAYLVLISAVIYSFSYWTIQTESSDEDPRAVRLLNRLGRDLQSTGMARVARAVDPMPDVYYEAADFAGLLYQNPLAEARLSRYPGFISLGQRPEFQSLAQDQAFSRLRLGRGSFREVLDNPNVSAIVRNPDLLRTIWGIVTPDLPDATKFLKEGKSDKYTDRILGRWFFDVNGAAAAYRRAKPNAASTEMQRFRATLNLMFSKTMMVAGADQQVWVKNVPQLRLQAGAAPAAGTQDLQGQWKKSGDEYEISLGSGGTWKGRIESGRLIATGGEFTLVFTAED